jgi:hypothetical protein
MELPTNKVHLQDLFTKCSANYDWVFVAMQRDHERMLLLENRLVGKVTQQDFEHRYEELEKAAYSSRVSGLPSFEQLQRFFDSNLSRGAEHRMRFGKDALAEGNGKMSGDLRFAWMIVAGLQAIDLNPFPCTR